MGISQQIGSSSLSRPGVCTFSTRPATPYEGQMIYETDTDLSYIYGGSAWQQIAGGTAVGNSGLVYVTSATIGSGVSSVTVSSCFSTTYDNYRILINDGVSSQESDFAMTLGSTATGYYYTSLYNRFSAGTPSGLGTLNDVEWRYVGAGTQNTNMMEAELQCPFLAKYTTITSRMVSQTTGNDGLSMFTQGYLANTTSYTAMTIRRTAGTMTGGTVTVYGYRK